VDESEPDYVALKTLFRHWQQGMHNKAWNALFWCNHDQPRIVSRFGDEGEYRTQAAKMLGMVLHGCRARRILPGRRAGHDQPALQPHYRLPRCGKPEHVRRTAGKGRDPEELLAILASKSRDNGRTPMQWDASHNAGFTEGEPWIGVCDNYETVNARAALDDPDSVFYTYQSLIALRKTLPVLTWGDYQDLLPEHPSCGATAASGRGRPGGGCQPEPGVPGMAPEAVSGDWQVMISNYGEAANCPQAMTLRPFEAVWWQQAKNHKRYKKDCISLFKVYNDTLNV
jgi:trehalose-6-phosphate hydrolase